MVYYFRSRCGEYLLYMGKDKYENEELIKYGQPEDIWFHVDDLSSAHVYLRLHPGKATLDDIPDDALVDCGSLVKANSIQGCKYTHTHTQMSSVKVIYTKWQNLKKEPNMPAGAVSYHRPHNVRTFTVESKNRPIVKLLEKTRTEAPADPHLLYQQQQDRLHAIAREQKMQQKQLDKQLRIQKMQEQQEREERSYDRILNAQNHTTAVSNVQASIDNSAAEQYEDDFF